MASSESESSEDQLDIWSFKSNKKNVSIVPASSNTEIGTTSHTLNTNLSDKFKELKDKRLEMSYKTKRRQDMTTLRIEAKKKQKTKSVVEESTSCLAEKEWSQVKTYLNVNEHLHGPIKHGKYGPRTELEQKIDDAIEDGEFDYAEMLSDKLAGREFGVKINAAFAAKKFAEKKAVEKAVEKKNSKKKLYWGFEAKNRWEMKGNM